MRSIYGNSYEQSGVKTGCTKISKISSSVYSTNTSDKKQTNKQTKNDN